MIELAPAAEPVRRVAARTRVVLVATATVVAVAAAAFAVVMTLPQPTTGERLAVRVVERLYAVPSGGAVLHIGDATLVARCWRLSGGRTRVTLSNGERFVVSRTRVHERTAATYATRSLAAPGSPRLRELLAVKAALAGIHNLYATSLRGRLVRGAAVFAGVRSFRGERAYRLRIGKDRPAVELLVSSRTLDPVAATYRSRRVAAWSRLLPPGPHRRDRC